MADSAPTAETVGSAVEVHKTKSSFDIIEDRDVDDVYSRANPGRKGFTKYDQKDMWRMGKVQELRRSYRPLSALSFAVILCAVWEYLLISNEVGLRNGGLAGLFWTYIWTFVGFGFVEMSLAEMASMAPISGGQYHWVSEFSPPKYQQFLSYMVGWMSTLSWQAGNASGSMLTGTMIQALLSVNNPDTYIAESWHGTLLAFAMVAVIFVVNIWGAELWSQIQNFLLILHTLGFLVIIITLWVMAPHRSAKDVFTSFTEEGGWGNIGLSLMVGQLTSIYSLLGSDATAHMAEEVRDAGRYVPISLFWSYIVNGLMAIIFLITYVFCIPSVHEALNNPTGFPFIYVFQQALNTSGVNALVIIVLILVIAANVSFNASTARQTFAFARDKGLPFSTWIGAVRNEIPANAIALTCVITMLLSLINIGSSIAFEAMISLQVVALMCTYAVSISCVLYRRIVHPDLIPNARWSLGKWGVGVNCVGLLYVTQAAFWSFWPPQKEIQIDSFNWAVVLFVLLVGLSLGMYGWRGRKEYKGPVADIRAAKVD
ncbi:GABA permease [Amniculicola lignicola CBS 123094]|uniref:GABA permease n=1 Tax=Amniculicola lignicola CBS 123094 TaxID=1392246 RepID=A0A6A5X580_9PLEO|nr:GABA permease [Amniculicola lignicola CBS 123094]